MALEYSITELPAVWPGKKTSSRKRAPFKTQWARTIELLERELKTSARGKSNSHARSGWAISGRTGSCAPTRDLARR